MPNLEIHVFGAAKGESIVLRLPSGEWGVVDCYAPSLKNTSTNPTLQFLLDRGVERLAFLCMTHPHDDHYRGMSQLLRAFKIDCFWRPAAMNGQCLKWIIKAARTDAAKSGIGTSKDDADELQTIFSLVKSQKQANGKPAIPKQSTTGMQLYPVPLDTGADFQIWALAPSGRQIGHYERSLRKCFDQNDGLVNPVAQSSHNVISMALLLIYGSTRIVFGGDVESEGWSDVLQEFGADNLPAHGVKISHHGSTNGYIDGLWKAFSKRSQPIAFLTSYRSKRLPRKEAIEHIRGFASRIATPCVPALRADQLPVPLSTRAPIASRKALHEKLAATFASPYPTGCCSFVFDNAGNCVDEHFEGMAGDIPL